MMICVRCTVFQWSRSLLRSDGDIHQAGICWSRQQKQKRHFSGVQRDARGTTFPIICVIGYMLIGWSKDSFVDAHW